MKETRKGSWEKSRRHGKRREQRATMRTGGDAPESQAREKLKSLHSISHWGSGDPEEDDLMEHRGRRQVKLAKGEWEVRRRMQHV